MPLDPDLIRAYEKADYVVFGEPELVIHVGEPNADLNALLEADSAMSAAYVTGANPHGVPADEPVGNVMAIAIMQSQKEAGYTCYEGEGRDPQGNWEAEPSVLVVGIARAEAEALGRRLEQNAIVFIEKGKAPELVLLA